ncbi:hypothetical protein EKO04_000996 [Ascochyta lentis]|uniref:Uncharacterized protein n=1 Tax=Ascochyta lentis TaxID=205686 RepID=A0A8H7MLK8_9PLEO|nr:hypothetical protein EKO04_000996 [Ascochyta lentis]
MLFFKSLLLASIFNSVYAIGRAIVTNQCDAPIYLWSVGGSVSPQTILPKDSSYGEVFTSDPFSGGIALKVTSTPGGIFTPNASQLIFAYNLDDTDVWTSHAFFRPALTNEGFNACCNTIRSVYPSKQNWKWMFAIRTDTDSASMGLSLLIALASDLKIMSLHTTSMIDSDLLTSIFGNSGYNQDAHWHRQVFTVLQSRLEQLTIWDDRYGTRINLKQFSQLRVLVIPLYRIQWRTKGVRVCSIPPQDVLPQSLETIAVCVADNKFYWNLSWIDRITEGLSMFPRLRSIEIRFQENLWSTAYSLTKMSNYCQSNLASVTAWKSAACEVTTMVGNHKLRVHQLDPETREDEIRHEWASMQFENCDLAPAMTRCASLADRYHRPQWLSVAVEQNMSFEELEEYMKLEKYRRYGWYDEENVYGACS